MLNLGKNLHHAYVIEGDREENFKLLLEYLKKEQGIEISGNPDFLTAEYDSFAIDDARLLKDQAQLRGTRKIFVISLNTITREAQNSLLKVFEEPTENTHFFILMPQADILLPTLKSRVQIISQNRVSEEKESDEVKSFLSNSKADRFEMIKKMLKDLEDEKITKSDIISFVDGIERSVRGKDETLKGSQAYKLENVFHSKQYLYDRSSSAKLILEYVALIV